ncbi:MAG: DUF2066 domain-containing protein [Gammaproteobacteria bacterium]
MLSRILTICLTIWAQGALADEGDRLYEAEVVVSDPFSWEARISAVREGMVQVFERLVAGGREDILQDDAIRAVLSEASDYVRSYRLLPLAEGAKDGEAARVMRIAFDGEAMIEGSQGAGLAFWEGDRPETMVLLAVEEKGVARIFNAELMPEVAQALDRAALKKGLPLLFPLMDLEDQQSIGAAAIEGGRSELFSLAASRYGVDVVLAGKIVKKRGCWTGNWSFFFDREINRWSGDCIRLDDVLENGMQGAYRRLSFFYAIKHEAPAVGTAILKVSGIGGTNDMERVVEFLESLPAVVSVRWLRVEDGSNFYGVEFQGDLQAFEGILSADAVLVPEGTNAAETEVKSYRLSEK